MDLRCPVLEFKTDCLEIRTLYRTLSVSGLSTKACRREVEQLNRQSFRRALAAIEE